MIANHKPSVAASVFHQKLPVKRQMMKYFIFILSAVLLLWADKSMSQEIQEETETPLVPQPPANLPQTLPGAPTKIPAWIEKEKNAPFDVKKYWEKRTIDPDDNAAPLYFWALADVSAEMDFVYPADQWKERLPQVRALMESIGNLADEDKLKAGSIPITDIENVLRESSLVLAKIDLAQQKKRCVFISGLRFDSLLPHIQGTRSIARLGMLQIHHARTTDNFDEAERAVTRTFRLARDLRPRGLLINQLVANALENITLHAINLFTLNQSNLTPEQCDRLLTLLADRDRLIKAGTTEGLKMEYLTIRCTFNDLQNGQFKHDVFFKTTGTNQFTEEQWKKINWPKEIAALNRSFANMFDLAAKPYDKSLYEETRKKEADKQKTEKTVLAGLLIPSTYAFFTAQARTQTQVAGSQCLIAVRKYVLAHGELPADLAAALAETDLKTVPLDPFDGKPMRYKVIDEKPVVYSVGPDQKDDGATLEMTSAQNPGDIIFRLGE